MCLKRNLGRKSSKILFKFGLGRFNHYDLRMAKTTSLFNQPESQSFSKCCLITEPGIFYKKPAPDIFAKYRLAGGKLHHVTENLDRNFRLIIAEQFQEMSSVKIWLTYLERSECLKSWVWCTNYLKRSERLRRSVWSERLKNSPVDWFPRAKREASTLSLAVDSNT